MKKIMADIALCAVCGAGTWADGRTRNEGSFCQNFVIKNFARVSLNDSDKRIFCSGYDDEIYDYKNGDEEFNALCGLGLVDSAIDTAYELAAAAALLNIVYPVGPKDTLIAYSETVTVVPQDAIKIYAEIAIEGVVNRYLGVTGTTHKEVLDRLQTKYKFSQSQITGAIRQMVSAEVDAQFKGSRLLPSEIQAVKDILTRFFISPNTGTFNVVRDVDYIYTFYAQIGDNKEAYRNAVNAYEETIKSLNRALASAVVSDVMSTPRIKSGADNVAAIAAGLRAM
jgi:hypothetical protein